MNRLPLPARRESVLPRVLLATAAMLVAVFLMAYYVQLLHDAVARGEQLRYSQRAAPVRGPLVYADAPSVGVR